MKRTYRSKKDTGGGLDPKDLLSYVDAKSSVFDAFYIQNIKQTKREVSYLGSSHHNKATYKVRKKKFVKRIFKNSLRRETGEQEEQFSRCAFLTPDKSIHVNKAPDPFDMLLKSSPTLAPSPMFISKTCKNTYGKKKQTNKKKIKSDTICKKSSESDKENSRTELSKLSENMSDIKNHELIIEKINNNNFKCQDESINNIINRIPFLTNTQISRQSNNKMQIPRIGALRNLNPASNSPLCSTPFQQKYRSKSIFDMSPILFNLDRSPTTRENNSSDTSYMQSGNDNEIQNNFGHPSQQSLKLNSTNTEEYNIINSVRRGTVYSSWCTTETEPFYGFENMSSNFNKFSQNNYKNSYSKTDVTTNCSVNATTNTLLLDPSIKSNNSACGKSYENIVDNKESSSYDTCDSDKLSSKSDSIYNNLCFSPRVVIERMPNSIFFKFYKRIDTSITNLEVNSSEAHDLSCDSHSNSNSNKQNTSSDTLNKSFNPEENEYLSDNCLDEKRTDSDNGHESSFSGEEDTCIGFVTTRRGNKVNRNSSICLDKTTCSYPCIKHEDQEDVPSCSAIMLSDSCDSNLDNILIESISAGKTKICSINKPIYGETIENDFKKPLNPPKTQIPHEINTIEIKEDGDIGIDRPIVLQPGKKWERSLSIYKRMTTISDHFDQTILDDEASQNKGRRYRQSVIDTIELQKLGGSLHNESNNGRRSTFMKPSRSTIKIVKENRTSVANLCSSTVYDDLKGFLSEDCDDTIVDLSKLSIDDSVHEVTVLEKFHDTSRIATARDYVLRRCNQTEPILFDECYPDTELKNCHKIGEGVYGEVFLWRARDGQARVLKIIPIAGDIKVNGEPQKGFHEIISEIVIAMELSALRSPIAAIEKLLDEGKELDTLDLHSVENATDIFNEVIAVRCVVGAYPARLLDLWELYDECRGSDNDNPALLPPHQHFVVLELANAGQDLESYHFLNAGQAHALFLQVALGLAVGEEALQFEHRDLHWGNVLVAASEARWAAGVVRGRAVRVARRGVRASLIDYSLSRLSLRGGALFADLAHDEALFEAVGDRQFAVYRLMRERLRNDWRAYDPHTNVLWLHYLLGKMRTALRYKRPATKLHKHFLAKLAALEARMLAFGSAAHFVLTSGEFGDL